MSKMLKVIIIGFAVYVAAAALVLHFYQADPENMSWQERETFNLKQIGRLDLGADKGDVIRLLGSPDISEAKATDNGEVLILFYRTHHVKSDGITTRDECTPLLFKDDKLIAWGADAYSEYQSF
ncbi:MULTISPECIES: DUF3192 domain-containing protein [Pseudidiomarina]|jgi:hypothetical protein|uniref:SmpA / OmlA family n=2 Tax=Pseudidiomarina TaxID=2800384 RepID=A0A0K6GW98_9GAMM|nr:MULTISPECIES: DUF3192 domain-containing protein [Pseudidiomarina]MBR9906469.1 DUF3192 domain-containing protein [Gammaproteobacteria bacterium]RUO49737.1 DUF3192 domain-containing protein [Pseudidiomarina donghaiensis]CUA83001.1 Protein of unknown function (DUF3192) [Pseudidiomarina woesei]SFV21749.1 Protein of unknown function [Pseudidiomarina donghaiensis]